MRVQVIQAGCIIAQRKHFQTDSTDIGESLIRRLANNHSGFEALLLPLMGQSSSAEVLLYKQCQLALKAPKVG